MGLRPRARRDYPVDMADAHPATDSAEEGPEGLDTALRTLPPIEEKVERLSYGIGCQRAHTVAEIAAEFGVGADLVEAILEEAKRHLAERGVARQRLQQSGPPGSRSRHRCRVRSAKGD
jgi:DNA-directed RNA polymerase sigma subunit (sigma70/sigma32)